MSERQMQSGDAVQFEGANMRVTERAGDKLTDRLGEIEALARKVSGNMSEVYAAIAETRRKVARAVKRTEALPAEYERVDLAQSAGPKIEFTGRLLRECEFVTGGAVPLSVKYEIWETRKGALIGVQFAQPANGHGYESCRAKVIEQQEDPFTMRLALLDWFEWRVEAASMATKLKWDLRVEVE